MNIVSKKTVDDKEVGKIIIADEVMATIAGTAALEVEGVFSTPTKTNKKAIIKWINKKNLAKDVNIEIIENEIYVDVSVIVVSGVKLTEVSKVVQDKIKNALEIMTGMNVVKVNVLIVGVVENLPEN